MGRLYQNICPGWCFTHNLDWHKGGRIIVAWKGEDMKVDIKRYHSQYIHLEVVPSDSCKFMCTFVYGATDKQARQDMLNHLQDMNQDIDIPWITLGDFNCITNLNERIGNRPRIQSEVSRMSLQRYPKPDALGSSQSFISRPRAHGRGESEENQRRFCYVHPPKSKNKLDQAWR